jgi:hypothetical protein
MTRPTGRPTEAIQGSAFGDPDVLAVGSVA